MENKKSTILIVDDVRENITVLNEILKSDYIVLVALNGKKALEIIFSENKPDLILLDIMMPEMNGYEVCEEIKKEPATKDIPVIFITAKSEIEDETKGFELGAVDYITKPVSKSIVEARVKAQLNLKKSKDQLEQLLQEREQYIKKLQMINIEVSNTANYAGAKADFLTERIKQILKAKSDIGNKLDKVANFISLIAVNDLGNLKIVEKILDESSYILDSIVKNPSPEEEYFRMLGSSIEPLKTAISDIESVIRILIDIGIVPESTLSTIEVSKTAFYETLEHIYQMGKLSQEKFEELIEHARFKIKTNNDLDDNKQDSVFLF